MTMQTTIALGFLMAAIAIVNTALMAWLWRFPMQPDPTGRDPNGVSTAPRSWTNVHRMLGYVFVLTYAVLLFEMLPRTWEFRVANAWSVVHGAFGVLVGVLLVVKIAVIRRFQRFGNRLPWIGGALAASTLIVAGLGIVPAWQVMRPFAPLSAELAQGRNVVARKCNQCHGASTIASEREDARKWTRITRKMQRFSQKFAGKEPITDEERIAAAAYLAHTLGEDEEAGDDGDEERDKEDDDRRGRGRGRRE
jgi:cytochrome c5